MRNIYIPIGPDLSEWLFLFVDCVNIEGVGSILYTSISFSPQKSVYLSVSHKKNENTGIMLVKTYGSAVHGIDATTITIVVYLFVVWYIWDVNLILLRNEEC